MSIRTVVKRNGDVVPFDPAKLSKWAEWSSVLDIDWFEIVTNAYKQCQDGCSTQDLHKALIRSCVDKETTAHLLMAGRLMVGEMYKEVFGGIDKIPALYTFYKKMVKEGFWEEMNYSREELAYLNTIIDHKEDLKLSRTQVLQDIQKYLIKDVTTKAVKETPQFALMRQAMGSNKNQPAERRINDVVAMYYDLVKGKANTPTPFKTNLGTEKRSYASCCVSKANDSEGSLEAQNHINWKMTVASAGQGNYMVTRSIGDKIRGGVIKHGGKLPYFRVHQAKVSANLQGSRGGALTNYLNALDPEIFTLLALRNPTSVEDKRIAKIDYAFTFNNSFKERAKKNKDWILISYQTAPDLWEAMFEPTIDHFEELIEQYIASSKGEVIKARKLLHKFLTENEVTGRLYEFNATNANVHTSYKDKIYSGNLCLEALMPTQGYDEITDLYKTDDSINSEVAICNLAAIVAGKVSFKEYEDVAYRTLLMVDNTIDITEFPLPHINYTAKARRSVGIGITNLAYAMASQGYLYSSQEGKDFSHRLAEIHTYSLLKASVRLAKEKGPCEWFHKTRYADGWLPIDTYCKEVDKITQQPLLCDWEGLRAEIALYGLRTSSVVNHMPCESSSIRNNDTNGLYPIRQGVVVKTSGNTKNVFIAPEWEDLQGMYELAWNIPHNDMVDHYAIFQKFADQGISGDIYHKFEAGKDKKVSLKQLMKNFFYRYDMGMKTRYYSNFATSAGEIEQEDACANGACKL